MPDFQINIKTTADLKAAKDLQRSLEDQIKATKALGGDSSHLAEQLKKVNAALTGAGKGAEASSGGFQKLGEFFSGRVLGGITATAAAIAGITRSIREFAGGQEVVAGLDQSLSNQGLLTDQYRRRLQELAGELQNTTTIAGDKWLAVLEKLTTFGSRPDTVGMDVEAVKNLAGILKGDLNRASEMIARAMQGNLTQFKEMGIVVSETGTKTERLQALYKELAERGAGILEAKSKTLNGQFRTLSNSVGDLFGAIGNLLSRTGLLQSILLGLANAVNAVASLLPNYQEKLEGVSNTLPDVNKGLQDTSRAVSGAGAAMETASSGGFAQIKTAADQVTESLKKASDEARKFQSEADQVDEAQTDLAVAQIKEDEARGKINPFEADKRVAAVKAGLAGRKLDRQRGFVASEKLRLEELERSLEDAAASAIGASAQTALAKEKAIQRGSEVGIQSDQELEAQRLRNELERRGAKGKFMAVRGPERERLKSELAKAEAGIASGNLTFDVAAAQAQAKVEQAQRNFDRLSGPGGLKRIPGENQAGVLSEAKSKIAGATEIAALAKSLVDLTNLLKEQRANATERSNRFLGVQPEISSRRRALEREQGLLNVRGQTLQTETRTERVVIESREQEAQRAVQADQLERARQEGERRRIEQLDRIKSGQPSASVGSVDSSQAIAGVANAAGSAADALNAVSSEMVQGFRLIKIQADELARQIATANNQIKILDSRQNSARLS